MSKFKFNLKFNKEMIKKIFIVFLCIQPILDLDILYEKSVVDFLKFSPSTIVRFLMVFLLLFLVFVNKQNWKKTKKFLIYSIIIGVYSILHIVNSMCFFDANNTGTFNFSLVSELFYLVRMYIPIIIIYITNNLEFSIKEKKKIFYTVTLIFSVTIVLSSIFKFGLLTYGSEVISKNIFNFFLDDVVNPYEYATRGLFEGANRLGILLTSLLPINLFYCIKSFKKSDFLVILIQVLSLILIGTRVATYGWIAVFIVFVFVYLFLCLLKKEKFNKLKACLLLVVCAISITMFLSSPMLNRKTDKDFEQNFSNNVVENNNQVPNVGDNSNSEDKKPTISDEEFIKQNYEKYIAQYEYVLDIYNYKYDTDFWKKVMNLPYEERSNGRKLQKLISDRVFELNDNSFDTFFGMGYSRFTNSKLYLERDLFVHYYTLGIIGLILFIVIPYMGVLFRYVVYLFKDFKNRLDFETIIYCFSICTFIMFAILSGHVFDEMITYIFIAFISGLILNKCKVEKDEKIQKELVSVIVPIYNCESYLEKCLDSVVNQTYGIDNLDVILINDCSKDNSLSIATKYCDKYKFRLIDNKKNLGLASSRNLGLEIAKGKYVCFLDSDDLLYDNAIEMLFCNLVKNGSDVVISRLNDFNSSGEYGFYSDKYMEYDLCGSIYDNFELLNCISVCSKLYKTDLIKKYNMEFLKNTYHEDISFSLLSFFFANKISVVPEYLYYRRIREDNSSIMQNLNMNTFDDMIRNYNYTYERLNNKKIFNLNILTIRKLCNYVVNNLSKEEYQTSENKIIEFMNKNSMNSKIYTIYFVIYYKMAKVARIILNCIKR